MLSIMAKITDAWSNRTLLAKLFSFASIGIVNVLVDVTCFTISFQLLHLSLIASNMIAWLIAVTGSYAMNTKITFGLQTGGALSVRRYLSFATTGAIGVIVSTTILVALSRYTDVPTAKLASIIAGFGLNFSMSHFVVFRRAKMNPVGS
jgi:putative flippase GtrA